MAVAAGFQSTLLKLATTMDRNKFLIAIKDAFTSRMSVMIAGSVGTLLSSLICSTEIGLARFFPALVELNPIFTALSWCSVTFLTLPMVYLIAQSLAKQNGTPEWLTGGLAISAYVALVPQIVVIEGGSVAGLDESVLGAKGLFLGMITAILVAQALKGLTSIDALQLHLPPSVPEGVSKSFSSTIPIIVILGCSALIGAGFHMVSGMYINDFIYSLLQLPLQAIAQHPLGIIGVALFTQILWFLGIHGGMVMTSVVGPLWMAAYSDNVTAFQNGLDPANPVTYQFLNSFVRVGGQGMVLVLAIAILLFSKRDDYKAVTKISFVPTLFNISEPMVYGVPLMLNPTLAIPFLLNPVIGAAVGMFAMNIGFIEPNVVEVPFVTPLLISAIVPYGWQGLVVQIVILAISILIAVPFVLMSNREAAEQAALEEKADDGSEE